MKIFYYRAYDGAGGKRTGTIEARDRWAADAELKKNGLRPYLLHDYQVLKKVLRQKQKERRRVIAIVGAAAVVVSIVFSIVIVRWAGRERPPDIEDYRRAGLVAGNSGMIGAKTKEERAFGLEIHQAWQSLYPDTVTGVDVSKLLMTVYVTRNVRHLSENELELLASNTVRALQRRFQASGCTVLVVEGDRTILEVHYNVLTRSTRVKSYR
jgi:hypothetical protein